MAHAPQCPALSQTIPAPQPVPAAAGPVSLHVGEPLAHEITPARHAVGVQAAPALEQSTQAPWPSHTPAAQVVPASVGLSCTQACVALQDEGPAQGVSLGVGAHGRADEHVN